MPDRLTILLDQNVPQAVVSWLKLLKPTGAVFHTGDVGLSGKADEEVFAWAQQQSAVVVTFDEDFADGRTARKWLRLRNVRCPLPNVTSRN